MEKHHSNAKKCHSGSCHSAGGPPPGADPTWGKQGEWTKYKQYSPLPKMSACGYKGRKENWEEVVLLLQMKHVEEVKGWIEKVELLDRVYKSKYESLDREYSEALENGYEEAYSVVLGVQKVSREKEAHIAKLEAELKVLRTEVDNCHRVLRSCCPERLKTCCPDSYCKPQDCHDQQVS